jgi:hypothetical protein
MGLVIAISAVEKGKGIFMQISDGDGDERSALHGYATF